MASNIPPPWQCRWKRPEIYPVVLDETFNLGNLSKLQQEQLAHMTPVQCTSAHLTAIEARALVQTLSQRQHDQAVMGDTQQLLENNDFIVVVTLLHKVDGVSRTQKSNKNTLADVILLEIITCSENGPPMTPIYSASTSDVSSTSIRLIYSKLMYWPSSILTRDSSSSIHNPPIHKNEDEEMTLEDDVSSADTPNLAQSTSYMDSSSQPFWLSLSKRFLPFLPSNKSQFSTRNQYRFKGVISASLCRRRLTWNDKDTTEDDIGNALQVLHLMNLGLPTLDDSTRNRMEEDRIFRQVHLHKNNKPRGITNARSHGEKPMPQEEDHAIPSNVDPNVDENSTQEDELLLACLSNNGKLYFFSMLQLFQVDENDDTIRNHKESMAQTHVPAEDSMSDAFESLILGSQVFSHLHSTIIPLTRPKATIVLSLSLKNRGMYGDSKKMTLMEGNSSKDLNVTEEGDHNSQRSFHRNPVHSTQRPFLDLASFDANIDPSTTPYRTYNNQGTLCKEVFDYIVIGGKGYRSLSRRLPNISPPVVQEDERSECHDSSAADALAVTSATIELSNGLGPQHQLRDISTPNHPDGCATETPNENIMDSIGETHSLTEKSGRTGGFISLISLQFFSEIRNFFLPFIPQCIHPMTVQSTRFILVLGAYFHECIAVQVDAWSELAYIHPYPFEDSLLDVSFGCNSIVLKKYEMLDVSISSLTDDSVTLLPISIVTDSLNETSILCSHPSGLYLCSFEGVTKTKSRWTLMFQRKTHFLACDVLPSCLNTKFIDVFDDGFVGGQGWSLTSDLSFICWEGATTALGTFHANVANTANTCCAISSAIQSSDNRAWTRHGYYGQFIHSYIRIGCGLKNSLVLTLRKQCCDDDPIRSINEILEWLGLQGDYSIQAKISLKLLDEKALMRDFMIMDEDTVFDGIVANTVQREERARLSDLTIGALVHVGRTVANVLEGFLERNMSYDPWTAGGTLMEVIKGSLETSLWAFSCILKIGVTRKCMIEILDVINTALPDEIRCRFKEKRETTTSEGEDISMRLYYTLISMILESTEVSAGMLLQIEDSDGVSYWTSLNHDTRLHMSLTKVKGRFPLLLEREVREWALSCLKSDIDLSSRLKTSCKVDDDKGIMMHSSWLLDLICGFFDLSKFVQPLEEAKRPTSADDLKLYFDYRLKAEQDYIKIISTSIDDGCFDFDLMILSLLVLVDRDDYTKDQIPIPCQLLLDLVCDQVARTTTASPFIVDTSILMSQCGYMKNISAVAHLIGGQDGLLLSCVDIVNKYTGIDIDKAEDFLCHGDLFNVPSKVSRTDSEESINLWKGRLEVMLLLEKTVLQLKKFGDLYSRKGTSSLDPTLLARFCFLSLYMLCQEFNEENILKEWLQMRLLSTEYGKASRFASIAVIRAILWPQSLSFNEEAAHDNDFLLAYGLGLGKQFLVDLCRSVVV